MLTYSIVIEKFLSQYPSASTRYTYSAALNQFFECNKVEPDQYFGNGRDYSEDVRKFQLFLNERPPKTSHTYVMAVKSFLIENNVELGSRFWKKLRNVNEGKDVTALTEDFNANKEQIRQLLAHGTVRDRAFTLCLLSSGMRVGELLKLKIADIDFTKDPVVVKIRKGTKTKKPRTTFFSAECVAAIKEYQKVRQQELESSVTKLNNINSYRKKHNLTLSKKNTDDDRLFPYGYRTMTLGLIRMLNAVGGDFNKKDSETNRATFHYHIFRKYFSKYMVKKVDSIFVDIMLGHKIPLGGVYKNYTTEELAAEYKKGEFIVSIYDEKDTSAFTTSITEKDKEIGTLQQQLFEARSSFSSFKTQMEDMKVKMKEELLAELIETLGPQHPKVQDYHHENLETDEEFTE